MPTIITETELELDGVLRLSEMAALLRTSGETIRRAVRRGDFPIPPLEGVDKRLRWWGPTVKAWLDAHTAAARKIG